jgi:GAF domain-containing protein
MQMPGGALRFTTESVKAYTGRLNSVPQPVPSRESPGRAQTEPDPHAAAEIEVGARDLARLDPESFKGGIGDVLIFVADSLHAGACFVARGGEECWRVEQVHDRVGMGILPGEPAPFGFAEQAVLSTGNAPALVVEDARHDYRFRPRSPGHSSIGAYMGVPLWQAERQSSWMVCTADPQPRRFHTSEVDLLRIAGRIIARFL